MALFTVQNGSVLNVVSSLRSKSYMPKNKIDKGDAPYGKRQSLQRTAKTLKLLIRSGDSGQSLDIINIYKHQNF